MSGFEEFTEAVAKTATSALASPSVALNKVAILGGGSDACLLAALCLSEEAEVTLFSAYGAELEALRTNSGISLRGAGPVGTYQIDRPNAPSIRTTAEIDSAVADADVIFLTGPIHKHRTYAMVLADHLRDGQVIVLPAARSLGALETAWHLRLGGCTADVTIVETQGLPYWFAASGSVLTLEAAFPVAAATLPSNRPEVITALKRFLPNLTLQDSVLVSGFHDASALVEFPALLIAGTGGPTIPMGGTPLPENQTFASLLGEPHKAIIARLADERRSVASAFGVRNLPSDETLIATHAGAMRGEGARPIPSPEQTTQILRDGVIGSLAPLISAAELTGTSVPMTQSMITLASTILGADVAAAGRKLSTIGIEASDIETARRAMDAIATGAR